MDVLAAVRSYVTKAVKLAQGMKVLLLDDETVREGEGRKFQKKRRERKAGAGFENGEDEKCDFWGCMRIVCKRVKLTKMEK